MRKIGKRSKGAGVLLLILLGIGFLLLSSDKVEVSSRYLSACVRYLTAVGILMILYLLTPAWICVDTENNTLVLPRKRVIPIDEITRVKATPTALGNSDDRTGVLVIKAGKKIVIGWYIKECTVVQLDIEDLKKKNRREKN
ncbi:MAG: hypothetical protein Q4D54_06895 [Eubacteriales bacterium]|nr:hypothetical protein [Eubacteriales bacterium]